MAGLEPGVSRETGVPATVVKAPLVACSVRAAGRFSLTKKGCDAGRRCVGGVGARACQIWQGELLLVST